MKCNYTQLGNANPCQLEHGHAGWHYFAESVSDTPRTDLACYCDKGYAVPADFARQLERELNEAKAEIARLKGKDNP